MESLAQFVANNAGGLFFTMAIWLRLFSNNLPLAAGPVCYSALSMFVCYVGLKYEVCMLVPHLADLNKTNRVT